MVSGEATWQGRHACASATAAGGLQGLQALSPRRWPPLGAFIKLPALRVVHDLVASFGNLSKLLKAWKKTEIRAGRTSTAHRPANVAILRLTVPYSGSKSRTFFSAHCSRL